METRKGRAGLAPGRAKSVVHARVGVECRRVLEELAQRQDLTQTQALRILLEEAGERMAEEAFGPRLESIVRTLMGVVEQQARHAARIEALVAILRKVEQGQAEREAQILQTLSGLLGLSQLGYAHLLGMVEVSSKAVEITASAQAKMHTLRGEG